MTANITPALEARLRDVSHAVVNKPPLCSGTWEIPSESFQLCFRKGDNNAGWLDLLNATDAQLDSLASACAPATFGVDNKDVMDLSYRKAYKMDPTDFMSRFDPERLGLSEFVRGQLLEGDQDSKGMRTELYKLNVYGKDSFFKSHKDTPRGVDMIGSLVVIFPTPHKGGNLILRHDGKEHAFDSGLELSALEKPSIGFAAFYSDVEHEVTVVESGHRLSLTYNLYVSDAIMLPDIPNLVPSTNTDKLNDLKLKQALSDLLAEQEFLPEGGTIGFGLRHKYPVSKTDGSLERILGCLKGSDATVRRVCSSLGLELKPKVIYKGTDEPVVSILLDEFPNLDYVDVSLERYLCSDDGEYGPHKGVIIKPCGLEENGGSAEEFEHDPDDSGEYQYQEVWWLTGRTELTRETTAFVAYGNESTIDHTYGDVVLIACVGGHANRQTVQQSQKRRRID